ncbi:Gfo/Idh/MocA family oxidoreductase [Mucilaginibacter daejeonensis]|uniref:Gfo/Idh/MocA family oxidoreductase n=1 Tax=Mucilaginibacter daejeonensis TaxID=398049 RepID=UPI001D175E99|nr:Gfo/Idh/MocA family oxidoreductase [Mucilaginibacter daejeonensis]UEG52991.1 Gfo/Idh/MocA family oxidoreductase [Mucilaginibacter daejeonensis]
MSAPIVTGILSFGMSGRIFHAPFVHAHEGFRLKAVVERSKKNAAQIYPGIISYDSVEDMLADEEIQLIIVNTPNELHFEQAKQVLLAGKHLLVEKPVTATSAQFMELLDLAKLKGLHVLVYQNRRWDSDFLSVKEVIESGRLGELVEVNFRFDRYKPVLSPKAFKEAADMPSNGLVYDLGPHLLDQAISLFGKPLSFSKVTASHREGSAVVDYFSFMLSYPHQLTVHITSGLLIAQPVPSFVVHGTLGSYIKDRVDVQEAQLDKSIKPTDDGYGVEPANSEGKLTLMGVDDERTVEQIPSITANYLNLFEAVYQTIAHGALYPITNEHIAWQLELLEA